jgi:hypothetical protein
MHSTAMTGQLTVVYNKILQKGVRKNVKVVAINIIIHANYLLHL